MAKPMTRYAENTTAMIGSSVLKDLCSPKPTLARRFSLFGLRGELAIPREAAFRAFAFIAMINCGFIDHSIAWSREAALALLRRLLRSCGKSRDRQLAGNHRIGRAHERTRGTLMADN